jgi:RCC1 and BTB domain-containing protein
MLSQWIHVGICDLSYGNGPHVIAVTSEGELFSWGHNGYGQLGQGLAVTSGQYLSSPQKIEGPLEGGIAVVKVACGGHHTLAIGKEGKV